MANQATFDDANLILRLYELRREELMRKARQWFFGFAVDNPEQVEKVSAMGSQENAYLRMVMSYWDMAASFVTSGVLNEDLFLQNNGELLFVWEKSRGLVENARSRMNNPTYMKNLETVAQTAIKRMGPEAYARMSSMVRGASAAAQQS
ncbi:MAG: hypothetical protein JO323_11740 [Acidobacteriia bacterium]|nr:hypothetical protein [Terriglobia bacterium]